MSQQRPDPPEETVTAICARCERPFQLPAFISEVTKSWMKREWSEAERYQRQPPASISRKELAVCDDCRETDRAERAAAEESNRKYRDSYLHALRSGVLNPDAINWLRARGHGAEVDRILKRLEDAQRAEQSKKPKPPF